MAESVVSFAIERLGDLLIAEGKFLLGVSGEVDEIKVELRRMKCFLRNADERQRGDERVRNWVAEIKDLAYRTEKTYLKLLLFKSHPRGKQGVSRMLSKDLFAFLVKFHTGKALHKVGIEIATIKKCLLNLTASLQRYGIQALSEAENSKKMMHQKELMLRISYPHVIDRDFVGMEFDLDNLVSLVTRNDNPDHKVILIKGMGGQGKTTIATKIYNHPQVQQTFEAFAWVCVTQEPGEKFSKISLESFSKVEKTRLREWEIPNWKSLSPAFPINEPSGSKVLLTSRKLKVGFVHELRSLTEDEGWELLQKKTFEMKRNTPDFKPAPEFENLGRKMVRHCEGLPLAIVVLGGILKDKSTPREWEIVNSDIHSYLKRGEGVEEDHAGLAKVLAMSYDDLPYCLKQCFMYIGIFPEDYLIDVDKLGLLWIAEGLISSEDKGEDETTMDVVERYLDELAHRSMVQIVLHSEEKHFLSWTMVKKFTACRLHDLMRDMAISRGVEDSFLRVVDSRALGSVLSTFMTTHTTNKTRRLVVYSNDDSLVYNPNANDETTKHLRSLLFFSDQNGSKLPIEISGIREYKFLRILRLEGFIFTEKDLQGIKQLTHLRYLSFRDSSVIKMFPSFIGDLRYLEILILIVSRDDIDPIIVPNVLWKLKRLRYLSLPLQYTIEGGQKLRLDGLTALESLYCVDIGLTHVNDIFQLPNISFLFAQIDDHIEDLKNIIIYMKDAETTRPSCMFCLNVTASATLEEWIFVLRELFSCINLQNLFIRTNISRFPSYNQNYHFSPGITKIHLEDLELEEDPMITLENFPNLIDLLLDEDCYTGKEMVCSSTGFPRLQILKLNQLPNLEDWQVDEGAMPNLCILEIWSCYKLKMLPEGLRFCHGLKKLKIASMEEEFNQRVKVINGKHGEDSYKVKHVPSIVIRS